MKLKIDFDQTPVVVLGVRSIDIVAAMESAGVSQADLARALGDGWTQQYISKLLQRDYLGDDPCEARFLKALKRLEFSDE